MNVYHVNLLNIYQMVYVVALVIIRRLHNVLKYKIKIIGVVLK